jgi:uncharacterized protein (DUF2062 family)
MDKLWQHADKTAVIGALIGIVAVVGALIYYFGRFRLRRLWSRFAPPNQRKCLLA